MLNKTAKQNGEKSENYYILLETKKATTKFSKWALFIQHGSVRERAGDWFSSVSLQHKAVAHNINIIIMQMCMSNAISTCDLDIVLCGCSHFFRRYKFSLISTADTKRTHKRMFFFSSLKLVFISPVPFVYVGN